MDAANAKFDEARELAASVDFQPMVEMIDEAKRVGGRIPLGSSLHQPALEKSRSCLSR